MLQAIFRGLGGLVGDTVEVIKGTGSELIDLPGALKEGFDKGLMITPEAMEQQETCPPASAEKTTVEPVQEAPVQSTDPFVQK